MVFLLLCSGDIETNPGPTLRSRNTQTEPDNSGQVLELLQAIDARTTELSNDIKAIKSSQIAMETKLVDIFARLESLETANNDLGAIQQELEIVKDTAERLTAQNDAVMSTLQDLEDRSRRNNVVLYGIPDERETWDQTEKKAVSVLSAALGSELSPNEIERAHRIGSFSPSKCRPVIIRFLSFKVKNQMLALRSKLKESNISISEDYSPATREVRRKLLDFAKNLPNSPEFHLRHNKLFVGKKCYVYDLQNEAITESARAVPEARASRIPHETESAAQSQKSSTT